MQPLIKPLIKSKVKSFENLLVPIEKVQDDSLTLLGSKDSFADASTKAYSQEDYFEPY